MLRAEHPIEKGGGRYHQRLTKRVSNCVKAAYASDCEVSDLR
jgi:hypothetical protein